MLEQILKILPRIPRILKLAFMMHVQLTKVLLKAAWSGKIEIGEELTFLQRIDLLITAIGNFFLPVRSYNKISEEVRKRL